jgi:predicted nucleic acid-binding protein
MIVVSDASPINYLLAIGQLEVLPKLFGTIIIPSSVMSELEAAEAPAANLRWLANLPAGFQTRSATRLDPSLDLDAGEREAICLAEELAAAAVLMDEKKGRAMARQRGLAVIGTVSILEKAASLQLLELETALAALQQTTFYGSEALMLAVLARAKKPTATGGE